ncbi:hypothetical protein AB0J86_28375 [Micromonospora sp. NPDC049559]|uniref:hypothetical protein n=1 Tax=Micromonospora sp. NPDC049559 TaxID=3155923 RepID=UPI003431DFF1
MSEQYAAPDETRSYSRVDLLRLSRRRQRRRWLLAGIAVVCLLGLLVPFLRPDPPAGPAAEPIPSVGYALPTAAPPRPRDLPVRVPGVNPVKSSPTPSTPPPASAPTGPLLTVDTAEAPEWVDLTDAGPLDWVHWGRDDAWSVNRKRGARHLIDDRGGPGWRVRFDNGPQRFGWRDGAGGGVERGTRASILSCGGGFTLSVAAGTQPRTLRLYAGVWQARGRLTVRLGSGGPTATAALEDRDGGESTEFTVRFRATAATELTVRWTVEESHHRHCGSVSLRAAALG